MTVTRHTRRGAIEPETRAGICCGCNASYVALYKIQGIYRYRCDTCFEREAGYRHHLAPPKAAPSVIVLP